MRCRRSAHEIDNWLQASDHRDVDGQHMRLTTGCRLAINEMSTATPATGWHFYAVLVTSSDIGIVKQRPPHQLIRPTASQFSYCTSLRRHRRESSRNISRTTTFDGRRSNRHTLCGHLPTKREETAHGLSENVFDKRIHCYTLTRRRS